MGIGYGIVGVMGVMRLCGGYGGYVVVWWFCGDFVVFVW